MARYRDPHLDPLRAPTPRGQHPYAVREKASRNPQHMYETRDSLGNYRGLPPPTPSPQAAPPPAPARGQPDSFWSNPLVWLGIGGLAAYFWTRATTEDDEPPMVFENPAPAPAPVPPQLTVAPVVAQPPAAFPVVAALPAAAAAPVQSPPSTGDKATAAPTKKRRVRKTTQARDPVTGTYLPAGTRKKPIVEGKK